MNRVDHDQNHRTGPRIGLGLPAAIPDCDDVLLFPCSADLDQPRRLAGALDAPARDG